MPEPEIGTFSRVDVVDCDGNIIITMQPGIGRIIVGGEGRDGSIYVADRSSQPTIRLDGQHGNVMLGGIGQDGDLVLKTAAEQQSIHLDGQTGNLSMGGGGQDGDILLKDGRGNRTIHLNGQHGNLAMGGNGQDGDILLSDRDGNVTIHLDGETGQITHAGGDAAEDFDVADTGDAEPGTVMVIDDAERLRLSDRPYDKRVAGVVSGAGSQNPGIVLDKDPSKEKRAPVALAGKVYCRVDADESPIEVGDLLTTSASPGHAMKATDPLKAFGAVIGKALRPLEKGRGLIPVLVALQ